MYECAAQCKVGKWLFGREAKQEVNSVRQTALADPLFSFTLESIPLSLSLSLKEHITSDNNKSEAPHQQKRDKSEEIGHLDGQQQWQQWQCWQPRDCGIEHFPS